MKPAAVLGLSALAAGAFALLAPKKAGAVPGPAVPAPPETTPPPEQPEVLPTGERVLRLQSPYVSGPDVLEAQQLLAGWGFTPGKLDGVFGPNTDAATRSFQRVAGLDVDGIIGPMTWSALRSPVPAGAEPEYGPPLPSSPATSSPTESEYYPPQLPPETSVPPVITTPPFVPPGIFTPPGSSGSSTPLPTIPGVPVSGKTPPDSVLAAAAAAIASNDPKVMRTAAAKMRILGWPEVASGLEAAALASESGIVMPNLPPSVFTPPTVKPPTSSPPIASVPAPASSGSRVLKPQTPMMQGKDVIQVQQLLQAHGFNPGTIDGVYGPKVVAAVLNFQRARKLTTDGQVGPATLAALQARPPMSPSVPVPSTPVPSTPKPAAPATSSPAAVTPPPASKRTLKAQSPMLQGSDVLWVQTRLQALGFSPGTIDGVYGPKSVAAVKGFQTSRRLVVDGIVGTNTYAALQSSTGVAGDAAISGFGLDLIAPPSLRSSTPLPGAVPVMMPHASHTPLQRAATLMVQNLTVHPTLGDEDRSLVKAFQAMNPGLNPTGMYGPGTAEALITQRTGHIPPTPRYWPKNASKADRAEYRSLLLAQAKLDPQRAEEWNQAAARVF